MRTFQQPVSGVNPKLYSSYTFDDHIWRLPQIAQPDLLELAQRCVRIGELYWLKQSLGGVWTPFKALVDASHEAESKWLHGRLSSGDPDRHRLD
jgi:hypothetical protein